MIGMYTGPEHDAFGARAHRPLSIEIVPKSGCDLPRWTIKYTFILKFACYPIRRQIRLICTVGNGTSDMILMCHAHLINQNTHVPLQ